MTVIHNYEDLITKNIVIKNSIVFSEKYRIKNKTSSSRTSCRMKFSNEENLHEILE